MQNLVVERRARHLLCSLAPLYLALACGGEMPVRSVLITADTLRFEKEELVRQAESMRTTFADFEQQFVDAEFAEHVDPDSGAALHALGYAR